MRIALAVTDGKVCPSLREAEAFEIRETEDDNRLLFSFARHDLGGDSGEAAQSLAKMGVKALICGAADGIVRASLAASGIGVLAGASGDAFDAIASLQLDCGCGDEGSGRGQCAECARECAHRE